MFCIFILLGAEVQTVHLITPGEVNYVTSPDAVLDFANYLYKEQDYRAATTEYERALFLGAPDTTKIILQLGRTYLHLGEHNLAYKYLSEVANDTSFALLGFSALEENDLDSAKFFFSHISDRELQDKLDTGYSEFLNIPRKSPLLAGLLSTVLPGLGRVYAGRGGDGIFGFIFTVGSFAICYQYYNTERYIPSAVIGGVGILFYLGDIYGSVESARLCNKKSYESKLIKFKNNFNSFF